jgi:hypothetical protein
VAKRVVTEVCCDRCTKTFYAADGEANYLCPFGMHLRGQVLDFKELCETCQAVVMRAFDACAPPPRVQKKDS